jgi:UDP-N-acetylmuramate: L-alanyl-gamma-D-glutamyl-meso-diaminopimelate ligase
MSNLRHEDGLTRWDLDCGNTPWASLELPLAGEHNALNATAATALAFGQGIPKDAILAALSSFKSVKRRLEVRARIGGITLIDDFAHHPTAIRETLRALRAVYPSSRLWAVLEPRSNTLRRKVLEADLVASLRLADRVVLAGVYQQQRIPDAERLHPEDIINALNDSNSPASSTLAAGAPTESAKAKGVKAELWPDADSIVRAITPQLAPGDVVAILSNGGFDGIYSKLPAALSARFPS